MGRNVARPTRREPDHTTAGDALLHEWRSKIAGALLLTLGLVGALLLINYHSNLTASTRAVGWLFSVGFLLASRIPHPPSWLGAVMVATACTHAGTLSAWAGHDQASAVTFFLLGIVLTAMLSGWRAGVLLLTCCSVIMAVAAWAELHSLELLPRGARLTEQARLSGNVFTFTIAGLVIVLGQAFLLSRLRRALGEGIDALARQHEESQQRQLALDELNLAHDDMRGAQARLVAAGKAELLGQLAAGIAHDMNNALTVVMGETELLRDTDPRSAKAINDAVRHASHLTRQLLALGRKDLVRTEPLDLQRCVEQAAEVLQRTLPSDVRLELEAKPEIVVRADKNQIQQVLLNLATNAAHAMPTGGVISVRLDRTELSARLTITDTGVGMDEQTQSQIFEPFFSTKALGQGTGLGLASVRSIVEQLGGTVHCKSQKGVGTTFEVELPLHEGETPVNRAVESLRPSHGLEGVRFLVVEDDNQVRAVVTSALLSAGASVVEAESPRVGTLKAEQSGHPFEILCTDVVMPEGGGGLMIKWFQQRYPDADVVICTGYSDDELLRRDIARGKFLLVRKPFSREQLLRACDEAVENVRRRAARRPFAAR